MSDTSTRSGMLWEVERILTECKKLGSLPEVLLMENVPQVHGEGNVEDFNKWQLKLEELGYKNYWQDLIATDYGIPQTRNRCFMVSILGDYSYSFPPKQELKLKLKDMLEDNVDEKYYLSDAMLNYMHGGTGNLENYNRKEVFERNFEDGDIREVASTITTNAGNRATDNFIRVNKSLQETLETNGIPDGVSMIDSYNKNIRDDGLSNTITTRTNASSNTFLAIKNATAKSTMGGENVGVAVKMKQELCNELIKNNKVKENDVIRHSYSSSRMNGDMKDLKQNNISPTLDTRCDCLGVVVNPLKGTSGKSWQFEQQVYDENGCARTLKASEGSGNIPKVMTLGNYSPSNHEASRIVDSDYSAPTIKENHGTITAIIDKNNKNAKHQQDIIQDSNGNARTLVCGTHGNGGHYTKTLMNDLRIRKLTPKECFRLMGVKDEDYEKCVKNQSNASLYHLAGDSIVVDVIKAIFKELL